MNQRTNLGDKAEKSLPARIYCRSFAFLKALIQSFVLLSYSLQQCLHCLTESGRLRYFLRCHFQALQEQLRSPGLALSMNDDEHLGSVDFVSVVHELYRFGYGHAMVRILSKSVVFGAVATSSFGQFYSLDPAICILQCHPNFSHLCCGIVRAVQEHPWRQISPTSFRWTCKVWIVSLKVDR